MPTEIDKYVIRKVREKRIEKKMSQSQLAFELGYASQGYIGMIESGKYNKRYSVEQLNQIAKILECSIHDFLPHKPI